ncbi:MAG: DUF1080 domain-containing protein [Planctomycetes bacterium]|nr:DUF1080 domain-containing protein [Planctomycetota bacterium]
MKLPHVAIALAALAALAALVALAPASPGQSPATPGRSPAAEEKKPEKPKAQAAAWTPLFNGKDLEGWKPAGAAVWKVEDGCLVGTQTDGKGGDLFTEKEFDNFEVRFTYRMAWPANSGIWFRDKYQFDILKWKNPVGFSGTLYCPGKMFITTNLDESVENRDGWNEGHIYANGDHLILWLNGKKVGECDDKTAAKGRVGIQVHQGDGFKGMAIHLKRLEIRPLKPGDPPSEPAKPEPAPPKAEK